MARLKKGAPLTAYEKFMSGWFIVTIAALLCIVPALGLAIFKDNPNTVKHSVDATLIDAHPYSQSTGKYTSELRWEGRFQLLDGRTIDQSIDGFFYKQFMNGGEKPIKTWVAVTGRQLNKADPEWVEWRDNFFWNAFAGLLMLVIGIFLSFGLPNRDF